MKRAPLEMHAWEFHSTDEVFLAPSKHEAVQMWRAGHPRPIGLEPNEPSELADTEVLQGLTVREWRQLGQPGIVDRVRPGCRS